MNSLSLLVYDGTTPIPDIHGDFQRAEGVQSSKGYPGGRDLVCRLFIPRNPAHSWLYRCGLRLVAKHGGETVFDGIISNIGTVLGDRPGNTIEAIGPWGDAMTRWRLQKYWADNRITPQVWREWEGPYPKCTLSRDNGALRMTPKGDFAMDEVAYRCRYTMPTSETIKRAVMDYDLGEVGIYPASVKKTTNRLRFEVSAAIDVGASVVWLDNAHDGDVGTSVSITLTAATALYLGADEIPEAGVVEVQFDLGSVNNNLSVMTVEYSSPAGWTALAITDGTDLAGATLGQSGSVTFTRPLDWEVRKLLKERAWLRVTVSANCDAISIRDFVAGLIVDVADVNTVTLASIDYLYFGLPQRDAFTGGRFTLGASVNNNAATLSAEYWVERSEEWKTVVIVDGTAVGGAPLAQSGDITFTTPTDMGQTSVGGKSAYWVRLRPSADLDAVIIGSLRGIGTQAWELRLRDRDGVANIWSVTANGAGTRDDTLGTPRQHLEIQLVSRAAQIAPTDDSLFGEISNIMMLSETGDISVNAIFDDVRGALSNRLSSYTGKLTANGYQITPFISDWLFAADILKAAAVKGDGSGASWGYGLLPPGEAAAPDGRYVLFLEPFRALTATDYVISVHSPNLVGGLNLEDEIYDIENRQIVEWSGEDDIIYWASPLDDSTLADAASIALYDRRDGLVQAGDADQAGALAEGRRALSARKDKAGYMASPIRVRGWLYSVGGARVPACMVEPGRRIKITNYADTGGGTWRTYLIVATDYDHDSQTVSITVDKGGASYDI